MKVNLFGADQIIIQPKVNLSIKELNEIFEMNPEINKTLQKSIIKYFTNNTTGLYCALEITQKSLNKHKLPDISYLPIYSIEFEKCKIKSIKGIPLVLQKISFVNCLLMSNIFDIDLDNNNIKYLYLTQSKITIPLNFFKLTRLHAMYITDTTVIEDEIETIPSCLKILNISGERTKMSLKEIKIPINLIRLQLIEVNIDKINYIPNSLKSITLTYNNLKQFPHISSESSLEMVYIEGNKLEHIPDLYNTNIINLYLPNNKIKTIDNFPQYVKKLYLDNNKIKELPTLPLSLELLDIENNKLKNLPLLPDNLIKIFAKNNNFQSLPTTLPTKIKLFDI